MLHNEVPPAVNQIEVNPYHQQIETQRILSENGIQIEAWAPFAEGRAGLFQNEVLIAGCQTWAIRGPDVLRWLMQRGVAAIPKSGG